MTTAFDSLDDFSSRILKREVVFFVGSGFSVDSEGNDAKRLMLRLAVRFYAMANKLDRQQDLDQWIEMFCLEDDREQPIDLSTSCPTAWETVVRKLKWDYYAANDWFCGAFERLLTVLGRKEDRDRDRILSDIYKEENRILQCFRRTLIHEAVPLPPIAKILFEWAKEFKSRRLNFAGKALFLDTLGFAENHFAETQIMDGTSYCNQTRYHPDLGPKLYPRHHVLARLAREGFCANIITTNYDLLLESAWQEVGFDFEKNNPQDSDVRHIANELMGLPTMMRIAGPSDFQTYGKGIGTSLILKVHGCVDQYRKCRTEAIKEFETGEGAKGGNGRAWRQYMKSVVFTYREIQNWRNDSWSRDYLANLQRTRVVAFAGYSLQDPVIHDSLRSVYEELADHNQELAGGVGEEPSAKDAPAYFFGSSESFHANEILNAATYAVRATPENDETHDNFIQFKFLDKKKLNANFPNLDDLFLWNYHLTMRKFQRQCLENHLGSILPSLIDRPAFPTEVEKVQENFETLFAREQRAFEEDFDRIDLTRTTGWTYWFQSRLLREFVWGEALNRDNGPRTRLTTLRKTQWYMPLSHRPNWSAWALVMEIALRKVLPLDDCYPVESEVPTIYFKRNQHWESLRLEMGHYQRSGFVDRRCYTSGIETTWVLSSLGSKPKLLESPDDASNRGRPFGRVSCPSPSAEQWWKAACSDDAAINEMKLKMPAYDLGVVHD